MRNRRSNRNDNMRDRITEILLRIEKGTVINVEDITVQFKSRYTGVTNRNIGLLLRERDDIKNSGYKTWVKQ